MHVVRDADHLEESLKRAAREAQSYFGRPEVFLERYVDRAHHVEAQIIADSHGNVFFLGERDCSVQRRHQKLIEETPVARCSTTASASGSRRRRSALAKEAGYVNAGTIECIMDEDGAFYFLEMNTRLQVEHTVTEMVTGLDLVALQIAGGARREARRSTPRRAGASIQCRINAEDPGRNFLPGPGSGHALPGAGRPVRPRRLRRSSRVGRSPATTTRCSRSSIVGRARPRAGSQADAPRPRRVRRRGRARRRSRCTAGSSSPRSSARARTRPRGSSGRSPTRTFLRSRTSRPPGPTPDRPADILVEVDGRRVPVRVFDERRTRRRGADRLPTRTTASTSTARSARRCRARS